jgi:hypothetical protein
MKKLLLICLLAFLTIPANKLFAQQTGKNEIALSYGVVSSDDIAFIFSDIITSIVGYSNENIRSSGIINLSYRNVVRDRWLLGATVSYEKTQSDAFVMNSQIGTEKDTYYTVGLEAHYQYVHNPSFQMYSGFGAAYTLAQAEVNRTDGNPNTSNKMYHFNFQVNLLGFRIGKAVGFFTELGFGYRGVVNAGLSARF